MGDRPKFLQTKWRIIDYLSRLVFVPTLDTRMTPGELPTDRLDLFIILIIDFFAHVQRVNIVGHQER